MPGRRSVMAWLICATLVLGYVWLPVAPAFGQSGRSTPIAVGSTGSAVAPPGMEGVLRSALSEEIASLGGVRLEEPAHARFVVQGAVTRLERRDARPGVEVQCEVSLVVSDARGGAVRVMLSGRAGARGTEAGDAVERAALQAAVRGALRPLPRALD